MSLVMLYFHTKELFLAFKKLLFFLLARRIYSLPVREKYLLCLRKGKKEPLSNDTGKEKKKMLNFKKDKMTPPL